ncbi:MAG: cobalamin-binding protein, partial [bacterium]|nr:cobalamin-binding protein [bacterium]
MNNIISEKELWLKLSEAVVQMDEVSTVSIAERILEYGYSPKDAIINGLATGMKEVGEKFAQKCYYVPEVLVCAETMYKGFNILKEYVSDEELSIGKKVVIGVVEGDLHDIGKNIVSLMLGTAGFTVYDLGKDVSKDKFLDKTVEIQPDIVALSTLMTSTLDKMHLIVDSIRDKFPDDPPKIMIGGAPVSA